MNNVHKLTEGAVLLAAFAVLLLISLYVPILGTVSIFFLALPFIMFAAKNNRMSAVVFLTGGVLLSLIIGSIMAIPLALTFGLTGTVIGDFIREKKGRASSFIAGTLVFLASLLLQYAAAVALFNINFIEEGIGLMEESISMSKGMLEGMGQNVDDTVMDQFTAGLQMIETLTPSLFVMTAVISVFLIQLVSFPIAKRFGINVEGWKPFREMNLPKSILWYYLITIVASFIFNPAEGSYWFLALVNIAFILQLFMIIQGLSFIFFISHLKGFPRAVPIIATVFTFLIPFLLYIVRILGIIDLGFDLRHKLGKK
ncbi:YybS family protein [Bacillus sp. ISL-47]|uniref:YybS family protein n=1 Tax=Bacillus sp. ISL-47 TaxID=2819130 RepID=UPI001BEAB2DD|nr:YybS family protein [Bacillus sp. ISL-47]MBT2687258.1 YybS family protein [Bacillus sp. ISL-47]MBT2706672.1 YybS family protein [Pseudomonas sp. ISL-84]